VSIKDLTSWSREAPAEKKRSQIWFHDNGKKGEISLSRHEQVQ